MTRPPSRRTVLGIAAAGAAALPQLGRTAAAAPATAAPANTPAANSLPVPPTWRVHPFRLDQVALGDGVLRAKRDLMLEYARAYPADRILAVFRANAGLDTRGANPPGGWETADGNLRGHYAGHFLTLVAQAYADTREPALREKLSYLVSALGECQAALAASDNPPSHPGYLAAYPETQFILLESYTTYPTIWAPYYTCHKIMRGLLDAHVLGGDEEALRIVSGMADWAHSRLSRLPREQLERMWGIYIAGEYGGMNEVLADLATLTGKPEHLAAARLFDNTALLRACVEDRDVLEGRHANQHIPQFSGYVRLYDETGDADYLTAARNFWGMVVGHRTYALGGTGQGEMFRARDAIAATLDANNAETCAAYNMLKLSRYLFFHDPEPAYLDYYERALTNQILASRLDRPSTRDPQVTYFIGMGPGVTRGFGNTGTCCGGTGMENHTKYQETVFLRSADGEALYVNLYVAATLDWAERGLVLTQQSDFPYESDRVLTVREGGGRLDLRLRVPHWATHGFTVTVNGVRQRLAARPGTYVSLRRTWRRGDVIRVRTPYALRTEAALDDPTVQSLFHGPVLLVARDPATELIEYSLYPRLALDGDLSAAVRPAGEPGHFTLDGRTLAPFHLGDEAPYHAYFRRSEPVIAFRGAHSGVQNRADADGTTYLDRLWSQAPFRDRSAFLRTARTVADEWRAAGRLDAAERSAVLAAAERADLEP
ncbi:glycosyl hydrolase [Streptomyces sp. 8K308]|uniref:glycoside hydrolase family 127 protein n=1 Tax=Streptomyces sp. 8K308 TaxID=2530388 RepID=UPI00104E9BDB|nr:beta-L-arabinofuranosidase domain-containing protein [Streptomyces sp. 8K308]TDC25972.1 glycosyl hydrolase [Streptomyces sp. 8K308]